MMGIDTVGIGWVSALFWPLKACALLASKAVGFVDFRTRTATVR